MKGALASSLAIHPVTSKTATLKKEEVYLWDYETLEEARARLPYFIERVHDHKRRHSSLDYRPPAQFETQQDQPPAYVLTNPA